MTDTHGALMDQVYRRQRLIYDATRKYYLLGRDFTLRELHPDPEAHVLEIACGTGRNLDEISARYPGRHLYGLDISSEMLRSAEAKLGSKAKLALGDACRFDPLDMFGQEKFDRILMSYCISMIPNWEAAISEALRHLKPCGELHIVDFGDQSDLPPWFNSRLRSWLDRFHVTPRDGLQEALMGHDGFEVHWKPLLKSYAQYARLSQAGGEG